MDNSRISLAVCLFEAIEDVNFSNVVLLLEKHGADPNTIIPNLQIAPIHYAVGIENVEFAEKVATLFIRKGGNPNLPSEGDQLTPLHIACIWGRCHIVHLLLQNGGDLDIKCNEKQTSIMYAMHENNFEVIQTIQKFVFEQKMDQKKKDLILNSRSSFANRADNSFCTPIKNNHLKNALQTLEEKKFTPNRINYNFDATSPYYINITHRRHKSSRETSRASEDVTESETTNKNQTPEHQPNLFDLTERNLQQFSRQMAEVIVVDRLAIHKRRSYIKDWRERVRNIRKSDTNLDVDYINYLNRCNNVTLLKNSSPDVSSDSSDKEGKSSSESFITANSSLDRCKHAINALPEPNIIEHVEEDYIHSDCETGIILNEKKIIRKSRETYDDNDRTETSFSTKETLPPLDYDTDVLRAELTNLTGGFPGPITTGTKRLYLKQLVKLKKNPIVSTDKRVNEAYSLELRQTINNFGLFKEKLNSFLKLEEIMTQQFIDRGHIKWREGNMKTSFIYLLIDPRISDNLPLQYKDNCEVDVWSKFIASIFYVGKGKRSRPYSHLYEAIKLFSLENKTLAKRLENRKNHVVEKKVMYSNAATKNVAMAETKTSTLESKKLNRIIEIWRDQMGVVCLHIFNNIIPCEAYTREAAIIEAIGLNNLTNMKRGDVYGAASSFSSREKRQMGIALLYRAMNIYLAEGESQLLPFDLI